MTAVFAIVKRLLTSNKISFIMTALVVICATSSGEVVLSNGNYTWLLAAFTPFFFVFYDFTKLMHLGASKKHYYLGCLISYGFLAFCISLVNTVIRLLMTLSIPQKQSSISWTCANGRKTGSSSPGSSRCSFCCL